MNPAQSWNQNIRSIEGMDIFEVLDISGSSQEREQFLAQLGEAIWTDVVQSKLDELTDDQIARIDMTMTDQHMTDNQKYERLFQVFDEAVPNAQQLVADTAKRVKIEFLRTRIEGLQEFYQSNVAALQTVRMASDMFAQKRYYDAIKLLKSLPSA